MRCCFFDVFFFVLVFVSKKNELNDPTLLFLPNPTFFQIFKQEITPRKKKDVRKSIEKKQRKKFKRFGGDGEGFWSLVRFLLLSLSFSLSSPSLSSTSLAKRKKYTLNSFFLEIL